MSSTTPSATKNSPSFWKLQTEHGKSCSVGRDSATRLPCVCCSGKHHGPAAAVAGVERVEPVGIEVVDDVADRVRVDDAHLADPRHRPPGAPSSTLRPSTV